MLNQSVNVNSILFAVDSYKLSHYKQYPEDAETVYSYIESRGGKYDETLFFGLQAFIGKYMLTPVTEADVDFAADFYAAHGVPFNYEDWMYIVDEFDGYLPITLKCVPEGTVAPVKVPLVRINNTGGKRTRWLTSFIETAILRAVWYPTTVSTISFNIKRVIKQYLEETGTPESLPFKLHDFGARGASSSESAMIGGMGHLVNFQGTDTVEALLGANVFYDAPMAGFSIPASEHSTITAWGRKDEFAAYENMVKQFGGEGSIYACVSDSYNIWKACEMWKQLEQDIIAKGGTLVVRPDSGDPVQTPVAVIERLMELFGFQTNDKGYAVLPDYIRVIQGDGVNQDSIEEILELLKQKKISADNIAFGMGGALLQACDRDTQKFAMKACAIDMGDYIRNVAKDPITDSGKKSKEGLVTTVLTAEGELVYKDERELDLTDKNYMGIAYSNGEVFPVTFDEIRAEAERYL